MHYGNGAEIYLFILHGKREKPGARENNFSWFRTKKRVV